jgi:aspartyl protease family protein
VKPYPLLIFLCLVPLSPSLAVQQIAVEALFTDRAMVRIDGVRRLLKLGEPSPEGVVLVSANSREAVLQLAGERRVYALGKHVSTNFTPPEQQTARIWRDRTGAYTTVGSINGRSVDFLVDTGASAVALPANEARRLGIQYEREGRRILVNTANGTTSAYEVTLDQVKVGEISISQVRAFVIETQQTDKSLLGMSFLNRVKMENQGSVLLLQKNF